MLHQCQDEEVLDPLHASGSPCEAITTCGDQWLRITSPCQGSVINFSGPAKKEGAEADSQDEGECWQGFCACCKRPLSFSIVESPRLLSKRRCLQEEDSEHRYAYLVALWGSNPEYVLGAAVLGWSLRRTGTPHDLVALYTADVPAGGVEILRRSGWTPRRIEYVEAASTLYKQSTLNMRFAKVFTKLRVFELVEYSKVLLLDADLLVVQSIDDLFELRAPAAMARGPRAKYQEGARIDGRYFFGGHYPGGWSWGQFGGINAGVMLLKPSLETFWQCMLEVSDPQHPEHINGNGPEQDYLSRFFASEWSHIDVANNFQLHQMYFALSPTSEGSSRARFIEQPDLIRVFHYSSDPKPWARFLDQRFQNMSSEEWCHEIKQEFNGYRAWVMKDVESMNCELERNGFWGVAKDANGVIRWIIGKDIERWSREDGASWRQLDCIHDTSNSVDAAEVLSTRQDERCADEEAMPACHKAITVQADGDDKVIIERAHCEDKLDTKIEQKNYADNWHCDEWQKWQRRRRWHDNWGWGWRSRYDQWTEKNNDADQVQHQDGWLLGEEVEVPEAAIHGAESVTSRSLELWEEAYKELQAYLKEDDLAAAVNASMQMHNICDDLDGHVSMNNTSMASHTADSNNDRKGFWGVDCDWWTERPLEGRAVASCAVVPAPKIALIYNNKSLFTADCVGLHMAAVAAEGCACPSPQTFTTLDSMSGLCAWIHEVPYGATVLLAIADPDGELAGEAFTALARGELGCPSVPRLDGYLAMAAVGKKGEASWHGTHAAPDVALASAYVPPSSCVQP